MQDEQANEGRREKKVDEQDSDIATTAAREHMLMLMSMKIRTLQGLKRE